MQESLKNRVLTRDSLHTKLTEVIIDCLFVMVKVMIGFEIVILRAQVTKSNIF